MEVMLLLISWPFPLKGNPPVWEPLKQNDPDFVNFLKDHDVILLQGTTAVNLSLTLRWYHGSTSHFLPMVLPLVWLSNEH